MTTYKLIQLPDATIVVSDEEIKESNWYFDTINVRIFQRKKDIIEEYYGCKKIMAGLPNLPIVKYKLSDEDAKKIGWVKINDIDYHIKFMETCGIDKNDIKNWIKGFQKAQSLTDKKFSKDDVIEFNEWISVNCDEFEAGDIRYWDGEKWNKKTTKELFDIWNSQQAKTFNCEIEIENNCVTVTKIL